MTSLQILDLLQEGDFFKHLEQINPRKQILNNQRNQY